MSGSPSTKQKGNMDLNNNPADIPSHLKLDEETHRLWESLLRARQDEKNLFEVCMNIEVLAGRFDGGDRDLEIPVSEELQSLIERAKDLADDWYAYDREVTQAVQVIAWRFGRYAYELHHGDYVQYRDRVLSTDHLFIVSPSVGDLGLPGRILTKAGEPGRREVEFPLLRTAWSKVVF